MRLLVRPENHGVMADISYYAAKIAECVRLLESSDDPLYRDVYQAMADEFAEKRDALKRRVEEGTTQGVPASPLLVAKHVPPVPSEPAAKPPPPPAQDVADQRVSEHGSGMA